jgi:hypothetical protein
MFMIGSGFFACMKARAAVIRDGDPGGYLENRQFAKYLFFSGFGTVLTLMICRYKSLPKGVWLAWVVLAIFAAYYFNKTDLDIRVPPPGHPWFRGCAPFAKSAAFAKLDAACIACHERFK